MFYPRLHLGSGLHLQRRPRPADELLLTFRPRPKEEQLPALTAFAAALATVLPVLDVRPRTDEA